MAAGLGFKDFTTGEVLTAADVDGYLMQGIWVFASAAARDAAVTSPQEGNACYLKDTNQVLTYSGSAWVAIGGGASGLTLIARTTFSNVASQTFDSVFSSSYFNYLIIIDNIYSATSSDDLQLQLRYGSTTQTSAYFGSTNGFPYTGAATLTQTNNANQFTIALNTGSSTRPSSGTIYINQVGNASEYPNYRGDFVDTQNADQYVFGGNVNAAQTYTGFLLKSASTNITGAVSIYGLAKA